MIDIEKERAECARMQADFRTVSSGELWALITAHLEALDEIERLRIRDKATLDHCWKTNAQIAAIEDACADVMGDKDWDDIPALIRALGQQIINQRQEIERLRQENARLSLTTGATGDQLAAGLLDRIMAEMARLKAAGKVLAKDARFVHGLICRRDGQDVPLDTKIDAACREFEEGE